MADMKILTGLTASSGLAVSSSLVVANGATITLPANSLTSSQINNFATDVQSLITNTVGDFATRTEVTGAISSATTNFATRNEVTGALTNYATLTGVSASFATPSQVTGALTDYATLTGVSASFTTPTQITGVLSDYATLTGVTGAISNATTNFATRSEITGVLTDYATLSGVSSSFTTPAQVTSSLTNYATLTGVTGALADYATLTGVSASFATPTQVTGALSDYATLTGVSSSFATPTQVTGALADYATLTGVSASFATPTQVTGALSDYATLVGVSASFTTPSQVTSSLTNYATLTGVTGALGSYATLTGVSASFATPTQVTGALSDYATLSGVSASFATPTQVTGALSSYATLAGVTASFTTPSQVTGAINEISTILGGLTVGSNSGNGSVTVKNTSDATVFSVGTDGTVSGALNAFFGGNITVAGTASIGVLNYLSSSAVQLGEKFIILMSGSTEHTSLDGGGILWGSGSGDTNHASILYRSSIDKLEIYPGISSSAITASDLHVNTRAEFDGKVLAKTTDTFTYLTSSSETVNGSAFQNVSGALKVLDTQISASNAARASLSSSVATALMNATASILDGATFTGEIVASGGISLPSDQVLKINDAAALKYSSSGLTKGADLSALQITGSQFASSANAARGIWAGLATGSNFEYSAVAAKASYVNVNSLFADLDLIAGNAGGGPNVDANLLNVSVGGNINIKTSGQDSAEKIVLSGSTVDVKSANMLVTGAVSVAGAVTATSLSIASASLTDSTFPNFLTATTATGSVLALKGHETEAFVALGRAATPGGEKSALEIYGSGSVSIHGEGVGSALAGVELKSSNIISVAATSGTYFTANDHTAMVVGDKDTIGTIVENKFGINTNSKPIPHAFSTASIDAGMLGGTYNNVVDVADALWGLDSTLNAVSSALGSMGSENNAAAYYTRSPFIYKDGLNVPITGAVLVSGSSTAYAAAGEATITGPGGPVTINVAALHGESVLLDAGDFGLVIQASGSMGAGGITLHAAGDNETITLTGSAGSVTLADLVSAVAGGGGPAKVTTSAYYSARNVGVAHNNSGSTSDVIFHFNVNPAAQEGQFSGENWGFHRVTGLSGSSEGECLANLGYASIDVMTRENGATNWANDLVSVKVEASSSSGTWYPKITVSAPALIRSDQTKIRLIIVNESQSAVG